MEFVVKDIVNKYGEKVALDGVSFSMGPGVYGLLGPNGAGKSTLMNIITGNLKQDQGDLYLDGQSTKSMGIHFRRILGYAPQQQGLYDAFTGRRFLCYMATLKEIKKKNLREEIERVASIVNLTKELDKRLEAYSGGMKQRILIAQALLGNPKLVIMDEPTAGLDPKERIRIREALKMLGEDKIILVATHVVSDIESIAKEIIIIKSGKIVAKNIPEQLVKQFAPGEGLEEVYLTIFGEDDKA